MIEFDTLASSSEGCAYRLSGGGAAAPLLIECGIPFRELQTALGFRVSELAACLVSHAHQDHCKAIPGLLKSGIAVFASVETWGQLPSMSHCHNQHRIDAGTTRQVDDWTVVAFEAVHDCDGTLGFVIDSPQGDRLLYLTDSCYSKFRFDGLTRIAVECNHSVEIMRANVIAGAIDRTRFARTVHTHLSIERLEQMLDANDLSKVAQIHLLHLSDSNSDEAAFKARIERRYGIPVRIAAKRGRL